ncbi:DUF3306 domain-containing protein [Azospirillum sp.]|uniref:DUF3306 domain-containing protein n=1 Tax=Azospirillum sp. TaxID=34012 RepID=UPI002D42AFB4|nr:DUF3306 domain-containing protein [Azospirillum sp.]HYD69509.1 DUF3306 domain-containing protein [Azospirillum sp.]
MAKPDATDPEGFLARWSRRKREAILEEEPAATPAPQEPEQPGQPEDPPPLPPIDSLGADSDYTRFLAAGVPEEVKRLALRKAWVSDPKIAEFRGFGEYDWDFNAPGYGQLLPTDDVRKLVEAVFRDTPDPPPANESEPPVAAADPTKAADPVEAAEPTETEEFSPDRERNGTSDA